MQPDMVINMFVANKCIFVQTARSPNRAHALLLHAQALELCCASPGVHRVPAGLHAQALELCCASPGPHRVPVPRVQAQLCLTLDEMLRTELLVFENIT